jgi:hypothetical protein
MKNYRKTVAVLVLVLLLATPAFAGEMQTGVIEPPPPPTANGEIQMGATDGEMHTGSVMHTGVTASSSTDIVTETALSLLHSMLSLF